MNTKHIIFDLDGTLIDSAPSILTTFSEVLSIHKIMSKIPLESSVIGPPLRETFKQLTGQDDRELLDALINTFKSHYDTVGYKKTIVFSGVPELIKELFERGIPIYIATNKRFKPTLLILARMGWTSFFKEVYSLDCVEPPYLNKVHMLNKAIQNIGVNPKNVFYIGDKYEDGLAADANSMNFFMANWGYGIAGIEKKGHDWETLDYPLDLLSFFPKAF